MSDSTIQKVLALNPADLDALRCMARQQSEQKKPKEAAATWRLVTEIAALDAAAWSELGLNAIAAEAFEEAGTALAHAIQLGVKDPGTLEAQARIRIRQNDFAGALGGIEEALVNASNRQSLWLLRAECARSLQQRAKEIESVERAATLDEVPDSWKKGI